MRLDDFSIFQSNFQNIYISVVIIDVGNDNTGQLAMAFAFTGAADVNNRIWDIKVTQIDCTASTDVR